MKIDPMEDMIKKNQTLTPTGATTMEMLTMDKFEFLAAPWPMERPLTVNEEIKRFIGLP